MKWGWEWSVPKGEEILDLLVLRVGGDVVHLDGSRHDGWYGWVARRVILVDVVDGFGRWFCL